MSDAVKRVQELLKLPQHLCKMCGNCCRIANFKGGLSYEEILQLIQNPEEDPSQIEGAIDFLSIFVPYKTQDAAREKFPEFVDMVTSKFPNASFFPLPILE